jgi:hypothetical protein
MNGLGLAALVLVVLAIFAAAVTFDHRAAGRRAPEGAPTPSTPQEVP